MYLHDASRSAATTDASLRVANAARLRPAWITQTGGIIEASASVVGSTAYLGSFDGYEYAINTATGAVLWKTFLGTVTVPGCYSFTVGVASSAAVANGVVYVGGGGPYFYALNATTGTVLWKIYTGNPSPASGHYDWSSPLLVTQASPDHAKFGTDRGRREFPAWRLRGPDVDGVFWVLDPAVAAMRWEPPEPAPPKPSDGLPHRAVSATIDGDDRTLHVTFTGARPEYAEYPAAEVIETSQALVVLPIARDIGPPGWRATVGCARTVTARLARPLGSRVVVDLDASPVMVDPGTSPR